MNDGGGKEGERERGRGELERSGEILIAKSRGCRMAWYIKGAAVMSAYTHPQGSRNAPVCPDRT